MFSLVGWSQDLDTSCVEVSHIVTEQLLENELSYDPEAKVRPLLRNESRSGAKYNPLTYLAGGMLFVYQNVFSEQISASCTYHTSCSETTKQAIQKYGLVKGTLIGLHQLSNCNPGIVHDHEEHMISADGKIINSLDEE